MLWTKPARASSAQLLGATPLRQLQDERRHKPQDVGLGALRLHTTWRTHE